MASKYHGLRLLTEQARGEDSGLRRLIVKYNGTLLGYRLSSLAVDVLGAAGLAYDAKDEAAETDEATAWHIDNMYDIGLMIGGGSTNIQKNIIGERGLGLPREPKAATSPGGGGLSHGVRPLRRAEDAGGLAPGLPQPIACRWSAGAPSRPPATATTRALGGLVAQGIAGLAVPERHGGAGLGVLDAAVAAESLGYHAAPGAVRRQPRDGAAGAAGERHGGPAAGMAAHASQPARRALRWALPAPSARPARPAWLSTASGSRAGCRACSMAAARRMCWSISPTAGRRSLRWTPRRPRATWSRASTAPGRCSTSRFEGRRPSCSTPPTILLAARTRVLDAGRVMLAADTLGAAQAMFDQAVAFAKERVQFGRVIGSFQGVKHTLADLATMLEPCRAPRLVRRPRPGRAARRGAPRGVAGQGAPRRRRPRGGPARHRGSRRHGLHRSPGPALLVQAHRHQPPAPRHARALPPRGRRRAGLGFWLAGRGSHSRGDTGRVG